MKESFLKDIRAYFREYCNRTSVHGFQYFGEKRTLFERIWWSIVFLICLSACIVSIRTVYKKWERSPVIVNFANRGTPIYKIPFPAVTVCPESKSAQSKFNFTKIMQMKEDGAPLTDLEDKQFEYMSLVCNHYSHLNYSSNDTFPEDFFEVMDEVKPSFNIQNCSFLDVNCNGGFTPSITDEGICYTFNILDRELIFKDTVLSFKDYHRVVKYNFTQWTLQDGYDEDAGLDPYPFRAHLSGAVNGLTFNIITPKEDLDYACKSSLQGYKVLLHTPMTLPRPSQRYFRMPLDQNVIAAIQPVMITTSETVKAYDPARRRCYFQEERRLRYFKYYTATNCQIECITNYTLAVCHCVDFFMPRENGTNICGSGKRKCLKIAEYLMHTLDLSMKIQGNAIKSVDCDCLPVCTDLTYEAETSQIDWDWGSWLQARRSLPEIGNKSHLSSLTLFFKSDSFITSERNELYGPIDFLANFGGILGLFTGFSVLSLMEILYFLTIRIICNLRLYQRWAGAEE